MLSVNHRKYELILLSGSNVIIESEYSIGSNNISGFDLDLVIALNVHLFPKPHFNRQFSIQRATYLGVSRHSRLQKISNNSWF